MKFSFKVFFCTIIVIAVAMSFVGLYFINSLFDISIEREIQQALDESEILSFTLETIALNVPIKYGTIQNNTIEEIATSLESGSHILISDEEKKLFYSGIEFDIDKTILTKTGDNERGWQIKMYDDKYFIHTATSINALNRLLYMETLKDVSNVFNHRADSYLIYRNIMIMTLITGAVVMFIISLWLTKPIKTLTNITKIIADGEYSTRAEKISNDELGQLTDDFNIMANVIEEKIYQLEAEALAKENFVAAFTHELKTPLTAIIGYADSLRSRKLSEEKQVISADYIFSQGKRLESLSIKLLDLIVLEEDNIKLITTNSNTVFKFIKDTFANKDQIKFEYENEKVLIEKDLIITVILNLIDNSLKHSDDKAEIMVKGNMIDDKYIVTVQDNGTGIEKDELSKITEAFYMIDKSRSRSANGAGLGLAICDTILKVHDSELEFESKVGVGTIVSFKLDIEK